MTTTQRFTRKTLIPWRLSSISTPTLITLCSRIFTMAGVVVLIALLPWLSGQDPALALLRARSAEQNPSEETLNAIRQSLELDQGPFSLMFHWLTNLLQGDPGTSWVTGKPILNDMLSAAGVSLQLMVLALGVAFVIASLLVTPTLRRGLKGQAYRSNGILAVGLTALPEFLLASLLLLVGAVWLRWLPPFGWYGFSYTILPALALGIPAGGYLGRLFSDAIAQVFTEAWVATWSVAGIRRIHIILAVLKRALTTVLPMIGLVIVSLTGGAIAVEKVFAIPGLGRVTLGAAIAKDLPTLQLGILLILLLAFMVGVAVNITKALLLGRALTQGAMPLPKESNITIGKSTRRTPMLCIILLASVMLFGLGRDPYAIEFMRLEPPSLLLPFGADAMGRDLLARVAHGSLYTCLLAVGVAISCLFIGLLIGQFPRLMTGPIEVANALPPVVSGLLVAAVYGPGLYGAALSVILISWAPLAAHAATLTTEVRARPYIQMLPLIGVGMIRRNLFYILPAVIKPLLRHSMLRVPGIALALASLGFLGLGAMPPSPEWGRILAEGMPYIERSYWVVLAPSLALITLSVFAVSSVNVIGARKLLK
ncbi:ABC transporter permease subunit [Vibrio sp. V31_P5A7T61]|uniref:ABC transporter permease subunit n=1 Tax=unclassified Vibrio TaxID=2614977 RepID=UPI001373483F|nr:MULTISPECIES: ABC transporter permease subunit [unclassified Vibrio]NAW61466.1 ABC transporter permease subunit [Vibrio sp. V31_P5A7T61]NAX03233.1 ABC transporter permease subunit [Vibrio sp. V34_P3A8T189]NAX09210.1 ABC transporter permease subunit [Vibrio sp. V40_P2S30T141]NAX64955.1 ABC transporter permease subunit [Vibrio sp. V32_P6A28T40]